MIWRVFSYVVLPALFVYLVASFLMSTFDINLWYSHQRFFAVVAYFLILSAVTEGDKRKKKSKLKAIDKNVADEKAEEVVQ